MIWILSMFFACGLSQNNLTTAMILIEPVEEMEFGLTSPYGDGITDNFTLSCTGEESVPVEDVYFIINDGDSFFFEYNPTPVVIDPKTKVPIQITFIPESEGHFDGKIEILLGFESELTLSRRVLGTGCSDADQNGVCGTQ